MTKIKNSYGIALLRYNNALNKYEILIVKKRISYAFADFVLGNYDRHNQENLKLLFNNMTNDEKIDILKGDYESLYYKLYLQKPPKIYPINIYEKSDTIEEYLDTSTFYELKNYIKKKNYYDKLYSDKNNMYMRSIIKNSINNGLLYEIPKGRLNKKEKPLDGAIREFYEETRIKKEDYSILDTSTIKYTFISNNIKYNIEYFIAFTTKQNDIKLNFNFEQISEIDEIKWMGIEEIRFIEHYNTNNKKISDVFKSAKNIVKKIVKIQAKV